MQQAAPSDAIQADLWDLMVAPSHLALLTPDEIFARADADLLLELGEDKRLERKPCNYSCRDLGDYVSMWANTVPHGGLIVVGQRDKKAGGLFEGLARRGQSGLNDLETAADTYCPEARCESKRIAVVNLKGEPDFVLLLRVYYHRDRVIKTTKGKAFIRRGEDKHELSADEVRQLQNDKNEVSLESEPCRLEYPSEFNRSAIQRFCALVRAARQIEEKPHPDEDVLVLEHLGKFRDGAFEPNIACALLFALDPTSLIPGCKVRFLRFEEDAEGTGDRWNAIKDETIAGTVPQIITETEKLLASQLRTFSKLGQNNKFFTEPEYPPFAWLEAIVNACAHRSYGNGLKNMPIFVRMFDDRLVVESPGPFPPFVTPSNIYDTHNPRNPYLIEAMRRLDYTKCAHEGTRRMKLSMELMKLPDPEFRQVDVDHPIVRVTLRNNAHQRKAWVDRDVVELIGVITAKTLNANDKRIVNFVAEHDEISVSDAVRILGGDWRTNKRRLMRLVAREILVRVGRPGLRPDQRDPTVRFKLNRE